MVEGVEIVEAVEEVEGVEEDVEEDPESAKHESFISHHRLPKGTLMNIITNLSIAWGLNLRLLNFDGNLKIKFLLNDFQTIQ